MEINLTFYLCSISTLKYLLDEIYTMSSFYMAVDNGDYLAASRYYNDFPLHERVSIFLSIISKKNNLLFEVLLPLTPSDINIIKCAILFNNDIAMRSLYDETYNSSSLTFLAASCGNVKALKYLHERGCPIKQEAIDVSVIHSHLECLKYMVSVDSESIGYHTFAMAAKRSTYKLYNMPPKFYISKYNSKELEILQYLHDINCIGDWDCRFAERHCHFCMNRKDIQLEELWIMYDNDYKNVIQWMPKEILEDIISLSLR